MQQRRDFCASKIGKEGLTSALEKICTVKLQPTKLKVMQTALKHGICFFGSRFTDVVFAMGKWKGDCWDGKIPIRFLTISPLLRSGFKGNEVL